MARPGGGRNLGKDKSLGLAGFLRLAGTQPPLPLRKGGEDPYGEKKKSLRGEKRRGQ